MDSHALEVHGIGKRYQLGKAVPRGVFAAFSRHASGDAYWALHDVSFKIARGEAVGILGRNGAGKSTLLKILARVTRPSSGKAVVRGRMGCLLEVGTGFHPELSGRDNIFLSGAMLGMPSGEVSRKFDDIVEYSGLAEFVDVPVKRYSSGMYVKLAFAVAAHLDPDILIVDEVLAVGDAAFQRKSLGSLSHTTQSLGRSVLFVSHNLSAVRAFCTRVLVLANGGLVFDGPVSEGIEYYLRSLNSAAPPRTAAVEDAEARITSCVCVSGRGKAAWRVESGRPLTVSIQYLIASQVPSLALRVSIISPIDSEVVCTIDGLVSNTALGAGGAGSVDITIDALPLTAGEFRILPELMTSDFGRLLSSAERAPDLPYMHVEGPATDGLVRLGIMDLPYKFSAVVGARSSG